MKFNPGVCKCVIILNPYRLLTLIVIDLSIEGLYRLSGQTSEILCIKEKYDDGQYLSKSVTVAGKLHALTPNGRKLYSMGKELAVRKH